MKCMYCAGKMERKTAPFQIDRKGYHLTFDAIPAWVCTQCGEAYFEETEVESIQKLLKTLDEQTEKNSYSGLGPQRISVYYDVFNGDADGIRALHQLRLAEPRAARLISGVKRDIALLKEHSEQRTGTLCCIICTNFRLTHIIQ